MTKENNSVELKPYTAKSWIKAFVLGLFIGLAVIIPGVSGSTVAIMFGLYASLLYAIGNIFKDFKKCVKFLIPIGIGAVIGFAAGFLLVQLLLEKYIFVVICLFVGLMIGASPALLNEIKGESISGIRILLMVIGVIIPLGIGALSVYLDPPALIEVEGASEAFTSFPWYLFLLYVPLGVLISATQLIPGLSATAIMMALGQFKPIMDSVHLDYILANPAFIALMLCLVGGFGIGLIIISKAFSKLLAWRRAATFYFVIGLSFGSIASMFLNPDIVQVYFNWGHGGFSVIELIVGIILLGVGLTGSALLTRYGLIHESNESNGNNNSNQE
jgi:putative membrane protein